MGIKFGFEKSEGGSFTPTPAGLYQALLTEIVECKRYEYANGERQENWKRGLRFKFKVTKDGEDYYPSKAINIPKDCSSPRSNIYKICTKLAEDRYREAIATLDSDKLKEFLESLTGKHWQLMVTKGEKGDYTFVSDIFPLPDNGSEKKIEDTKPLRTLEDLEQDTSDEGSTNAESAPPLDSYDNVEVEDDDDIPF